MLDSEARSDLLNEENDLRGWWLFEKEFACCAEIVGFDAACPTRNGQSKGTSRSKCAEFI